jgi:T5SS/PEP-CTERM-associated repeat protein
LYVQNGGQVSSTSLYVGNSGSGMLYVQNGGQVSCTDGYLGYSGSSSGGTVTVTGSGSTWAGSGALYVGYAGKGTVSIRNGGAVANTSGYLGYSSGSSGTVTVDGSGSAWTCSGDLYVGGSSSGAGGTGAITVQNGGQVTVGGTLQVRSGANTVTLNSGGQLAANVETVYGTVIQTGGTNTTSLSVPSGGTYKLYSGTLQITGGLDLAGTLDFGTPGGSPVAYLNAPSGIINLAETGSSVLGAKAAALDVGASAILILPASLAPTDFGAYANAGLLFAQGSTLTVGPGQGFTGLGNLLGHIDSQGTLTAIPGQYINVTGGAMVSGGGAVDLGYGRLIVTDIVSGVSGGSLKCGEVDVSYASGSIGTAVVEGSGSTVTCSGWLNTGGAGTGALTIRSGAQVSSVLGSIGGGSGPGGTVTVDGSGSVWANSGALYVGSTGGTGTLTVQNGGHVSSATGFIAYQNIGTLPSGTVIVDGNGSTWTNSGDLYVGRDGPGILTIRNGGYVCNAQAYIAYIGSSSGSVTVDGAGSTWVNTSSLNFGGVTGTLTIQNGGHVSSADGYIGALFGNSNGTVVVDGAGSLWNDSGSMYLAGSATQHVGTGSVTVQNGGGLTVAGTIRIWSKGTLAIQSGGSVTAGDLDKKTGGTITWTDGTLGITGASGLTIGSTGPLGSALTLDAGKTLNVTNTATIASGASVSLSGGSLTAGALANAGSFNWTTGTLGITGTSGLVIDAGGPLGASVTLGEGKTLNVTNTATVAAGASLTVDGGSFSAGNLANLGTLLVRAADTTVFTSAIENSANVEFAVASGTGIFGQYLGGSGTFTKSGAGTLLVAGPQDYEPGATFSVLDGTLRLDSDTGAGGANLSISVTDAEVHFGCDQELDTLIIGDGGKVVFADAHVVVLDDLVISGFDFGAMTLTPEPATVALLALGGVGVWVRRRQK